VNHPPAAIIPSKVGITDLREHLNRVIEILRPYAR
jgi:hypothetical protein